MAFTKRGLRLVKSVENYITSKPDKFDAINIFKKIQFTAANENYLKATMIVDSSMCNGYEVLHGGYIATVIDIMCLYARMGKSNGKIGFTSSIYLNLMSTAAIGDKVIAEAKTLKDGKSSIMETVLYKENGVLVAKGTACFQNGNEEMQKQALKRMGFDVTKTND